MQFLSMEGTARVVEHLEEEGTREEKPQVSPPLGRGGFKGGETKCVSSLDLHLGVSSLWCLLPLVSPPLLKFISNYNMLRSS